MQDEELFYEPDLLEEIPDMGHALDTLREGAESLESTAKAIKYSLKRGHPSTAKILAKLARVEAATIEDLISQLGC